MAGGALVLDFDGTVLDTEEPVYRSWAELWADHGEVLDRTYWQTIIGTAAGFDPWKELETRLGRPLPADDAESRRAERDELQADYQPRAGILTWLEEARTLGVPVGIASSSPADWVDGHLARLGLLDYFTCIVCTDTEVPPKPEPMSYLLACRTLDRSPELSVAVEDSPHGIAAATAAGLYTVAVPHGLTSDLDLSGADKVIDSLAALALTDALAAARARR